MFLAGRVDPVEPPGRRTSVRHREPRVLPSHGDPIYPERGRPNAQRLMDRRVESAGAWFLPYDFDFDFARSR